MIGKNIKNFILHYIIYYNTWFTMHYLIIFFFLHYGQLKDYNILDLNEIQDLARIIITRFHVERFNATFKFAFNHKKLSRNECYRKFLFHLREIFKKWKRSFLSLFFRFKLSSDSIRWYLPLKTVIRSFTADLLCSSKNRFISALFRLESSWKKLCLQARHSLLSFL